MYRYFFAHKDCYSDTWRTKEIEDFIESTKLFLSQDKGAYKGAEFFCDIQLMLVSNWVSWNSNDYDATKTNYVSIVVGEVLSDECETFLEEFSKVLGWNFCEEM